MRLLACWAACEARLRQLQPPAPLRPETAVQASPRHSGSWYRRAVGVEEEGNRLRASAVRGDKRRNRVVAPLTCRWQSRRIGFVGRTRTADRRLRMAYRGTV